MRASSIPAAASVFPRRADRGELSILIPRMKRTDAMRYATRIAFAGGCGSTASAARPRTSAASGP